MSTTKQVLQLMMAILSQDGPVEERRLRAVELLKHEGFDPVSINEIMAFFDPAEIVYVEETTDSTHPINGVRLFTVYECAAITEAAREQLTRYQYLGLINGNDAEEIISIALSNERPVDEEEMLRIIASFTGTDIDLNFQSPYF